jgi:hypothetical protein
VNLDQHPGSREEPEVIALAEKRIGEELERGRAELLFGDR